MTKDRQRIVERKQIRQIILLTVLLIGLGCSKSKLHYSKGEWIQGAFLSLESGEYPKIKAISWWHEDFDHSQLTINSSSQSLAAYQKGVNSPTFITKATIDSMKLVAPTSGIYHAAFPNFGGTEDLITVDRIKNFEAAATKEIVWTYFSNNWYDSIKFPLAAVNTIKEANKIPFIRMMARTSFTAQKADPIYSMQRIINGDFDAALTQWAVDAANVGTPLLVEFGTEVNGDWFPWNATYNGGATKNEYGDPALFDGAERFRDAYRHIIDICNTNGATNITWFFHVDAYSQPHEEWNQIKGYYPGDDYIDWLGVSIYGPQKRKEAYQSFAEILNDVYPILTAISAKPIAILEFGITELH